MSKAFVNEDTAAAVDEERVRPRPAAPLPITPRGAEELRRELALLDPAGRRAREIARILTSVVVQPPDATAAVAMFGSVVEVRRGDGRLRSYQLVGPDEADPRTGRISVDAPVARALLGRGPGAVVTLHGPGGEESIEVVRVTA